MRFMRSVCSSIPSQDCPLMADTCQNIFWVLIYPRSANATPLSHITIPLSIWMANAKSRPAVLAPSRAPADLPTKNGCTRLPMPLRLQVVITDNYLPRNASLRGWAALYIPRRQVSFRHAVFPKNIAEFWPVLGYCPHARVQSPLITFRSGHWPCHAKPREEMPFLGCNA